MPMITLRYVTPTPRPELREILATRLAAETLGEAPMLAAAPDEPAAPAASFTGGQSPAAAGLSAFWLTIPVTAGANTKADTTRFVREAFTGIEALLGPLHRKSYVLVQAADGHAYGMAAARRRHAGPRRTRDGDTRAGSMADAAAKGLLGEQPARRSRFLPRRGMAALPLPRRDGPLPGARHACAVWSQAASPHVPP
jgi:4-oxalocrotonate tautomerase